MTTCLCPPRLLFHPEAEVSVDNSSPRASTYGIFTAVCLGECPREARCTEGRRSWPLHQLLPPLCALVSWNQGYLLASCTPGLRRFLLCFLKAPSGCVTSLVSENVSQGAVPGLAQASGCELLVSLHFSTAPSLYTKLPMAGDVAPAS